MTLKINYQTSLSPAPCPQKLWPELLDQRLIQRNELILSQTPEIPLLKSTRLWTVFNSNKPLIETHNYTLKEHNYGPHSQYLHLGSNLSMPNEIDLCFPYIQQLSAKKSEQYEVELFQIVKRIPRPGCYEEWRNICQDIALNLDLVSLTYIYLSMLAKGTHILGRFAEKYSFKPKYLWFKMMQIHKWFTPSAQYNRIEYGDKVSLENLSRTCKILYCPICICYDCNKHQISQNAALHSYQYVRSYDPDIRTKVRKEQVFAIFRQVLATYKSIHKSKEPASINFCSKHCYKQMNAEKWDELSRKRKNKAFSYIFRIIIEMGKELFDFNPCKITTLFDASGNYQKKAIQSEVKCSDIFYYFMKDYALPTKLQYKFYDSEILFLKNQTKEVRNFQPAKKKRAQTKKKSKSNHKNCTDSFHAVCFHYFTNCQPQDIGCFNCECRKRGYCLPECQCSQLCMLQMKGCKCKAVSTSCLTNCPCYKQKRLCIPNRCQCYHNEESGYIWCKNNQSALSAPKLTRVGQSTIESAGLGLFAGQMIRKGEFVIKYTGEKIQCESVQKMRECLGNSGLFYNFKLNSQASIDSRTFGNKSRFINHSLKSQNLRAETIKIREEQILIFRALRDIQQNQELFFDYNGGGDLSDHKDKYPFIQ